MVPRGPPPYHFPMQLVLSHPLMDPFEPGRDLKALVACESSADGQTATELLGRLASGSGLGGRLIYCSWNFELLTNASLRRLAASEAAAAAMIVVAARAEPPLPEKVVEWISLWLAVNDNHSRALVALLDSGAAPSATSGALLQLKKAAALGRMDFFAKGTDAKLDAMLKRGAASPPGNLAWRPDLYATNCRAERD